LPGRRRRAEHWQELTAQAGSGSSNRSALIVGFQRSERRLLGRRARLGAQRARGRRLLPRSRSCRRACSALARAGTQTSSGRSAAAPAETGRAQHVRDRGGRNADPQLEQLTLNSHVAPARVLARQPLDQAARLGRKRGTTRPAASSAMSSEQCPVPAPKRLRADCKAGQALGRQQPAGRSKQRSIGGRVARTLTDAPQDRQLVAQHHDFKLTLAAAASEQANKPAQEPIQQTGQHAAQSRPARAPSPTRLCRTTRVSLPHRLRKRPQMAFCCLGAMQNRSRGSLELSPRCVPKVLYTGIGLT
jgi:hypothetical protein